MVLATFALPVPEARPRDHILNRRGRPFSTTRGHDAHGLQFRSHIRAFPGQVDGILSDGSSWRIP